VQKITFVLRKINKNCCSYSASLDTLAVFREPVSKGRGEKKGRGMREEGRERRGREEGRRGEGRGEVERGKAGSSSFALGRKKKSRRLNINL